MHLKELNTRSYCIDNPSHDDKALLNENGEEDIVRRYVLAFKLVCSDGAGIYIPYEDKYESFVF